MKPLQFCEVTYRCSFRLFYIFSILCYLVKLTNYNPLAIAHEEHGRVYFLFDVAKKRFAVDVTPHASLSEIEKDACVYQFTTSYDCGSRAVFRKAYESLARTVRSRLVEYIREGSSGFAKV